MANSNFKHLEFLPLDEENLVINDSPESNLRSKSCLNLGFIALNASERLVNINNINKASISSLNNFLGLSYLIETALTNICVSNTISNPQNTEVTEHYRKRNVLISNAKILPSFGYCQNLTFSKFKTWGGYYGSLAYFINLREEYEEYYTPSQIIYFSVDSLLKYTQEVVYNSFLSNNDSNYLLLRDYYTNVTNLLSDESFEADRQIYNASKNIILATPLIQNIFTDLRFYSDWLPKVIDWYSFERINQRPLNIIDNPSTNTQRARNTLIRIVKIIYENGLDGTAFNNIDAKFIKSNLNSSIFEILSEITSVRKVSTFVELDVDSGQEEETLVRDLFMNIPQLRDTYDYRNANNIILDSFAPPGGYALWLVSLAATLMNRAYIISYKMITTKTNMFDTKEYRRVLKLLGYASILLIKTSLPHLQSLGVNILRTFRLYIGNIDPNNLLDL